MHNALSLFLYSLSGGKPVFPDGIAGQQAHAFRIFFMQSLIAYMAKKGELKEAKMLEVGSWIGSSALVWLSSADYFGHKDFHLTCCDAWTNTYGTEGYEKTYPQEMPTGDTLRVMSTALNTGTAEALFRHNITTAQYADQVSVLQGLTKDILPQLRDGFYDAVYVDAGHNYSSAKGDLVECKRLVEDGGYICGDDLELFWHECDQTSANERLEEDMIMDAKTGRLFHAGVSKAVYEEIGAEVSCYWGFWVAQKQGDKWIEVDLIDIPLRMPTFLALGKRHDQAKVLFDTFQNTFVLSEEEGYVIRKQLARGV